MPVRLHLDTSDYAVMYGASSGTPEAAVRDQLRRLVECGELEIGISYHVIVELLPQAAPQYRDDRLARARLIKELCRRNALAYDGELGRGCQFSTDARWLPQSILDDLEIERLAAEVMKVAKHPRRSRRRWITRQAFAADVRTYPAIVELAEATAWPLNVAFCFLAAGELRRYILGEMTREEANRNLRSRLTDPVLFYQNWIEPYGMKPCLARRESLWEKLQLMMDSLESMLQEGASIAAEANKLLKATGEQALGAEARQEMVKLKRDLKTFKQEITSADDLSARVRRWAELYGEKSARIAAEIFFAFHREKRRLKPSDAIDFAHALFLPHVDLWRGDRAFSDLLIKHRVTGWERVVPALSEVPASIDAWLTGRAA